MSNLHGLLDAIPMPDIEPFQGEALLADGWQYRDLPRMTPDAMDKFKSIVGEVNLRWLSFADYGHAQRGQVLISPAGMESMQKHLNAPVAQEVEAGA
jgi:hypothetical protein